MTSSVAMRASGLALVMTSSVAVLVMTTPLAAKGMTSSMAAAAMTSLMAEKAQTLLTVDQASIRALMSRIQSIVKLDKQDCYRKVHVSHMLLQPLPLFLQASIN